MSLAVPYLLDAASDAAPGAVLRIAGHDISAHELNQRTIARAERYLDDGHDLGDLVRFPATATLEQLTDALGAARLGLVLADDPGPAGAPAAASARADRAVAESRVWSETPLAVIEGRTFTHGDLIRMAQDRSSPCPELLRPLRDLLRSIGDAAAPG